MGAAKNYDLVVVGAGPGGYVGCVRAAQLGMKVACVERHPRLGGVCLNVGCIPSKALLDASEFYHLANRRLADYGVIAGDVRLDLARMMARKNQVVAELTDNVRKLLASHQVEIVQGTARLVDARTLAVAVTADQAGAETVLLEAGAILLATGSEPVAIPTVPEDGVAIVGSTEALNFDRVPEHLVVVGGGYIGLELGSVWRRLGARVTVVEMLPQIAGPLDGQVRRALQRLLTRQGLEFLLDTRVESAVAVDGRIRVQIRRQDQAGQLDCDRVLVAVGRRPLTRGLGLEDLGVKLDPNTGQVRVDARYRTSVPSIYAVGDLVAGPMLAHKASAEAVAAVEGIAGLAGSVNYDAIPAVIYTAPEVATVGLSEDQVKERGIDYCIGTYPFSGAGRARCLGETDGFVKVIAQARTDRLLGVHIIGPRASDMIGECVLAMEFGASSEDLARTAHGHPTFAEALQEAALNVRKCSIYAS